jgi:hypothetical protein
MSVFDTSLLGFLEVDPRHTNRIERSSLHPSTGFWLQTQTHPSKLATSQWPCNNTLSLETCAHQLCTGIDPNAINDRPGSSCRQKNVSALNGSHVSSMNDDETGMEVGRSLLRSRSLLFLGSERFHCPTCHVVQILLFISFQLHQPGSRVSFVFVSAPFRENSSSENKL